MNKQERKWLDDHSKLLEEAGKKLDKDPELRLLREFNRRTKAGEKITWEQLKRELKKE